MGRFGRLTVVGLTTVEYGGRPRRAYEVLCDCGVQKVVYARNVDKGFTKSCGCLQAECRLKHGHSKKDEGGRRYYDRTYNSWHAMKQRCLNPNSSRYVDYGGRGITVYEHWLAFENFLADMDECPEGMTIERIDNNGNYEPSNCKWATIQEQANNTRTNHRITYGTITLTLTQWANSLGLTSKCLSTRLSRGWPLKQALFGRSVVCL